MYSYSIMRSTYKKHIKNRNRRSYKSKKNSRSKKHSKSKKNSKKVKSHNRRHKRSSRRMRGGFGAGAGPLGFAWVGKDVNTWPGAAGVDGQSNFLPLSPNGVPAGAFNPPENTSEENMTNKFGQQGGGLTDLIPQDLVNFSRSLTGSVQGAIYGYQGVERPYSTYSSPTTQPGLNTNVKYIGNDNLNIKQLHLDAGTKVASGL
jgi:hypothetical protein